MTKEDYLAFIELQDKYESEKSRWESFFKPLVDKSFFLKRRYNPSGRYAGSVSREYEFNRINLIFFHGDCDSDTVRIDLAFDPEWLIDLDTRVQEVRTIIDNHYRIEREKEKEKLLERLKQLENKG